MSYLNLVLGIVIISVVVLVLVVVREDNGILRMPRVRAKGLA